MKCKSEKECLPALLARAGLLIVYKLRQINVILYLYFVRVIIFLFLNYLISNVCLFEKNNTFFVLRTTRIIRAAKYINEPMFVSYNKVIF